MPGVDDAIVEMKFDNLLFERKLEETIKSLDALRESLDFSNAQTGLQDIAAMTDGFNLDSMAGAIDSISNKFSALGAVAFTVIQNMTNAAIDFGRNLASKVIEPIFGGKERALNIEQAKFLFEGIGLDVEAGMASALAAVKGTAFSLDQAALSAAQFGASGIKVGEDMTGALRGVAGVAALTSRSFKEIGDIFASSAGTNIVNNQDLQQFATRGLNAAAALAKVWGTTEEEVKQMASNGEINFKMFAEGMDEAFGEHATTANKTYAGSLANVRAAFARMGASFFTPRLVQQRDLFNALTPVIDNVSEALQPLIKLMTEITGVGVGKLIKTLKGIDLTNFKEALSSFGAGILTTFAIVIDWIDIVKEAFRDIFPKSSTSILVKFAEGFLKLATALRFGGKTAEYIKSIFRGVFATFAIAIEIVKGVVRVFAELFNTISDSSGLNNGGLLSFFASLSEGVVALKEALVDGGGIANFFEKITDAIKNPAEALKIFKDAILGLFGSFGGGKAASDSIGVVGDRLEEFGGRFEHLMSGFRRLGQFWDWLVDGTEGVRDALSALWDVIDTFFSGLADSMKSEMSTGDFEGALDIFNVVFLGGIGTLLYKFFKDGLPIDFGGGILGSIKESFEQLTGVLSAMQTELKSRALLNIAFALAVLTASLVVLSMIDSANLSKALIAMAGGFSQLALMITALTASTKDLTGRKLITLAVSLILIAGAMLVLATSMKVLSTMSWDEIAKGLAGVAGGLTAMVGAIRYITTDTAGLVKAGLAMIVIAVGLRILANAMQAFATMGWEEIAKGLVSVGAGLAGLVTAMNMIDAKDMISAGIGIIAISIGMRILANAMQAFATMGWEEIGKGLVAVGAALGVIVLLTNTMPAGGMVGIGVGLIAVGVALNLIARAVATMGGMDIDTLGKGLMGLGVALLFIIVATTAMQSALPGAAAMLVVAAALLIVSQVIETLGELSVSELVTGLAALAGIFIIVGVAAALLAPVVGPMLALGAALALIGIGMAAFGAGAYLAIKAFELLGRVGKDSMLALVDMIAIFVAKAPLIGIAIARIIVGAITDLAEAAPTLIKAFKVVFIELLDAIIELAPKVGEVATVLFGTLVKIILDNTPDLIDTGIKMILSFMDGIRDNIGEFIDIGSEIIVNFLDGLAENSDSVVEAGVNLIVSFLEALSDHLPDIVTAGLEFVVNLVEGIANNISLLIDQAVELVLSFVQGIVDNITLIVATGVDMVVQLISGIAEGQSEIIGAVAEIITTFITEIGNHASEIVTAGTNAIVQFLSGITNSVSQIATSAGEFVATLLGEIADLADEFISAGVTALSSILDGIVQGISDLSRKVRETGIAIITAIAKNAVLAFRQAVTVMVNFLNGMADTIEDPKVGDAFRRLGRAIVNGILNIIVSEETRKKFGDAAKKVAGWFLGPLGGPLGFLIRSPSKKTEAIGDHVMQGLINGLTSRSMQAALTNAALSTAKLTTTSMEKAFDKMAAFTPVIEEINPVITPVLDLTEIKLGAKDIDNMMAKASIGANVSIDRAQVLADDTSRQNGSADETPAVPVEQHVTFEQNIYAPEALSTNDIYRNTRSQIALAKEELKI